MMNKKTQSTPKGTFWDWLAANSDRVRTGLENHEASPEMSQELGRTFERYYPGLAWEIGPMGAGRLVFYVSADGQRSRFPRVEKIVRSAPSIPGWEIQAFKPRCPLEDFRLKIGDYDLSLDDVWFTAEPAGHIAKVTLYIRGWSDEPDSMLSTGVGVLLDNAVGEYDAVMRVNVVDCRPFTELPVEGTFPLSELPAYLDRTLPPVGPD